MKSIANALKFWTTQKLFGVGFSGFIVIILFAHLVYALSTGNPGFSAYDLIYIFIFPIFFCSIFWESKFWKAGQIVAWYSVGLLTIISGNYVQGPWILTPLLSVMHVYGYYDRHRIVKYILTFVVYFATFHVMNDKDFNTGWVSPILWIVFIIMFNLVNFAIYLGILKLALILVEEIKKRDKDAPEE